MNKAVKIAIASVTLLLLLFIALAISNNKEDDKNKKPTPPKVVLGNTKSACEILTKNVASQVLGSSEVTQNIPKGSTSSLDFRYTKCIYNLNSEDGQVSLSVRSPNTTNGRNANLAAFSSTLPGSSPVGGIGDSAYWYGPTGQLNVLKNNTWYQLSLGSTYASKRNIADSQKLLDQIKNEL